MTTLTLYVRDASGGYAPADPSLIISEARRRLGFKFRRGASLSSPATAKAAMQLQLVEEDNEVFACLFLDNQHRIIKFEKLFYGTIDSTGVYPRVVVKQVLAHNAAAVMIVHNHPSGIAEPSQADRQITQRLKQALELVDVRLLDHFVVGGEEVYSFAEHGLL